MLVILALLPLLAPMLLLLAAPPLLLPTSEVARGDLYAPTLRGRLGAEM